MAKKLYVGNLPHAVNNGELQKIFEPYGTVVSAHVIMDRDAGRSKGFGFVEMSTQEEAQAAIEGLNGSEVGGRPLTVNEARPQERTMSRGPAGGNRGGPGRPGGRRGF